MSKKAKSKLPSELNENWGSNYLMDGFDFDMDYGHGVRDPSGKEGLPQPSQSGFAKLPDGLIVGECDDIDFSDTVLSDDEALFDLADIGITDVEEADPNLPSLAEVVRQANVVSVPREDWENTGIVDLTWLSGAYQDPERLPSDPTDGMITELQECWGDRTDGIYRIDLKDREDLLYLEEVDGPEDDDKLHAGKLASIVRSAMRQSTAGSPLDKILKDLGSQIRPKEAKHIAKAVQAIKAEHGLVGNVYIRASAFPGLHRGKWSKQFAKAAKKARYLVACPGEDCSGCACSTGLKEVSSPQEIDWDWVYTKYAPDLIHTGRLDPSSKKASDKRELLRQAFLAEVRLPKRHIETTKVRHTMPADLVTKKEAEKALREHQPSPREVVSREEKIRANERKHVQKQVLAWKKAGLLSESEIKTLVSKRLEPADLLKSAATLIVQRVKKAKYQGDGEGRLNTIPEVGYEEARAVLASTKKDDSLKKDRQRVAERWIKQAMNEGFAGHELDQLIDRKFMSRVASEVSGNLVQIRKKHEGLAGHLYVDASAYASKTGTTGCEEGALKHRANNLKFVLSMDRCGSCVFRNANNKCQKYNKTLTDVVPHPDPEAYQRAMIAAKNETDQEETAGLFQGNDIQRDLNIVDEFGLHNASLDDVEVEDEILPSTLKDVSFGGFEV